MEKARLVLDDGWRIMKEYAANLRSTGQPGISDAFLKWVLTNYRNTERCTLVHLVCVGEPHDFESYPLSAGLKAFDRDDRKFVAVALAHPDHPPILEATDAGWWLAQEQLAEAGVRVIFLCPEIVAQRARRRSRR